MDKNNSYLPLIAAWENYLEISKKADIKDFAFWILKKDSSETEAINTAQNEYFNRNSEDHHYSYKSSEAAYLIWRMGKFIRYYTKPILLENGLASQDDFAILAHIDQLKSCSKKEAIEANIIESTTGIEIIKRLIKQGLIAETQNMEDKRQKIITLTKKGSELLFKIYAGFSKIQDVMADLNVEQREVLIQTLEKLDGFHTNHIVVLSHKKNAE